MVLIADYQTITDRDAPDIPSPATLWGWSRTTWRRASTLTGARYSRTAGSRR
ncbi:MAG TPA: hypothetical protein VMV92_39685 [Streptosporangiaceae bacterium]|nr:hypothetical protein [Streptosporangiaceae bacterium]